MKISKLKAATSVRKLAGVGEIPRINRTSKGLQKAQERLGMPSRAAIPNRPQKDKD